LPFCTPLYPGKFLFTYICYSTPDFGKVKRFYRLFLLQVQNIVKRLIYLYRAVTLKDYTARLSHNLLFVQLNRPGGFSRGLQLNPGVPARIREKNQPVGRTGNPRPYAFPACSPQILYAPFQIGGVSSFWRHLKFLKKSPEQVRAVR